MLDPAQIIGAIVLAIMAVVFDFLQRDNPVAMFSFSEKIKQGKSGWQRFLDFVEQPLFLAPVGIIGGMVGIILYAPLCLVCDACVLLALHRSRAVADKSPSVQIVWYAMLFIMITSILFGVGILVRSSAGKFTNDLARAVAEYIKPQQTGETHSAQKPQQPLSSLSIAPSQRAHNRTQKPRPQVQPPVAGTNLPPLQLPPIEISIICNSHQFPIKIPAGAIAYFLRLPLTGPRNIRNEIAFQRIDNTENESPQFWPDAERIKEAEPHSRWYLRCDATNHGQEPQDDVLDLTIAVHGRYLNPDSSFVQGNIVLNPVDHGKTRTFYVVNDCPRETQLVIPDSGTARFAGEKENRQFQFELPQHNPTQGFQFQPSKVRWTAQGCE